MTQEHRVPTQLEVDTYIAYAKSLRHQVLASLLKRVFHLPGKMTGLVVDGSRRGELNHATTSEKTS